MQQKKVATIFFTMIFALLLLAPVLTRTVSTLDDAANSLEVSVFTSPTRIQEGDNTTIFAEIRQATPDKTYTLGINVTNPAGTFSALNVTITTDVIGSGSNSKEYPEAFTEANTDYVGTYLVAVKNVTTNEILTNTSFTVGLTDKLRYARNEIVMIKGSSYTANENFTINIKLNETLVAEYLNITASALGIVNCTWQIPHNATPGVYTASIANATVKNPPDIQEFYVEVWQVQIWARNLANEPVVNLAIKVYNNTNVLAQFLKIPPPPTNETGWSSFLLATGNYTFEAFWKQNKVGSLLSKLIKNDTVLEEERWVQLSNLKIDVIDKATNEYLPFIKLMLEYNNTIETTETNLTGNALIHNLFTNVNYTVKAERYGLPLPPFQVEISPQPLNELTVEFPTYTMFVHVEGSKKNPAEGVRIEACEWSKGIGQPDQSYTTNSDGNVTFSLTFGKYRIRAYKDDVLLSETTIDLIRNQSTFIVHLATFNVDLNVTAIDYFGQPIPNAVVKVEQKATEESVEDTTGPDGQVSFSGILGGDSRISIYIGGRLSGTKDLHLTDSEKVTFNLNRYVVIAGYAVETSQFVTAIAIAILVVVFIVALTYKRLLKIFTKSK